MKIAIVVDHCDPEVHGSHDYYLARSLAKLGHDVVLVTSTSPTLWGASSKEYLRKRFRPGSSRIEGFTLLRIPSRLKVSFIPLMPSLYSVLKNGSFDVIHSHEHFTFSSLWSALAAKSASFVLMQTCYRRSGRFPFSLLMRAYELVFSRFVIRRACRVIALTALAKDYIMKLGAKKVVVLPTGVDADMFNPSAKNLLASKYRLEGNVVLCVARLVENKGVHILVEAFRKIKLDVKDAKLVIVGSGEMELELRAMAEGIANVHFLGRIPHDAMPGVYAGADVFAFPTLYEEPFGNVALEAAASGIPCVGSAVGGIRETVVHGKTGYHFMPGNADALAHYIVKLLKDRKLAGQMGAAARRRALEEFGWSTIAAKTLKVYEECKNGI